METPETDRQEKAQFWADLEDLMIHHPNASNIVLVGDCNSRLDANIDPTYTQVGPHVVGRRQTIPEPERDNTIHLMDFWKRTVVISHKRSPISPSGRKSHIKK